VELRADMCDESYKTDSEIQNLSNKTVQDRAEVHIHLNQIDDHLRELNIQLLHSTVQAACANDGLDDIDNRLEEPIKTQSD